MDEFDKTVRNTIVGVVIGIVALITIFTTFGTLIKNMH